MRRSFPLVSALALSFLTAPIALGGGPADPLFRLVPGDAAFTVAVEGFRDHAREVAASPLAGGLRRLPAVAAWVGGEQVRGVRQIVGQVEEALDLRPGTVREEIFGDAVVLALRVGPPEAPEDSRGLLLGRVRDKALLDRLVRFLDDAQLDSGELAEVVRKPRGAFSYGVRKYRQGGNSDEFHAVFDDGVFAWSNSEAMIVEVIDRKASGGACLGDDPGFRAVRDALPGQALASLYVSPRVIETFLANGERKTSAWEDRIIALFVRYVSALRYFGVAIEWREGIAIHSHESLDPARSEGWLRTWLAGPTPTRPRFAPLPATSIAAVVLDVNFVAAREVAWELVPEANRPWFRNLKVALQGLLMGEDLDTGILPRLGPGVLVGIEAPAEVDGQTRLPIVAAVEIQPGTDRPGPRAAIENAIRAGISIHALESKPGPGNLRLESRAVAETPMMVLMGARRIVLATASSPGRIVFGNVPEAVARFVLDGPSSSLEQIRSANFPEATTFAVVDLARLAEAIRPRRDPIARRLAGRSGRPAEAIAKDLDQLVAASELFRAATFTTSTARDASSIHRVFRLIAR